MATLEERYKSSYPIMVGLGRADADGVPWGIEVIEEVSPDRPQGPKADECSSRPLDAGVQGDPDRRLRPT